jgi:hypothetical protein
MSEPDFVVGVFKLVLKGKGVIIINTLTVAVIFLQELIVVGVHYKVVVGTTEPRNFILLVIDVLTGSVPPKLLTPESTLFWWNLLIFKSSF